jgi:signal peptidase
MCKYEHMACDGWSHPFARTLHVGDLILIQGVDPSTIKAGPEPDGDIIVFLRDDELIVHRAIGTEIVGNETYFITKGDANPTEDPSPVPPENVIGKLILRIPWIGHLALFMRDSSAIYLIVAIIILLVIVEFAIPVLKEKKPEAELTENAERVSDT